jgi:D-alanine-D-alanine ligase
MSLRVAVVLADHAQPDSFQLSKPLSAADSEAVRGLKEALSTLPGYRFTYFSDHRRLIGELSANIGELDLVLNLCDKGFHNDWTKEAHVPALLETLGVPYTGAGPRSLIWCFDKALVYAAATAMGVAVPRYACMARAVVEWSGPYPAFVKPNFADGSYGITREAIAHDDAGVTRAVSAMCDAFGYEDLVLVQEYLPGKDLSVGILGNGAGSLRALPILEESYAAVPAHVPHVASYEAKWDSEALDSPYHGLGWLRAELPSHVERQLVKWSLALVQRLECHDYARVDFRLDAQGEPRLLEVNPNPGWDYWTYLATMAGFAGSSYPELLREILEAACTRYGLPAPR